MNSAPVQLLPVDNGGGYKNTTSETATLPEKGKRFDDVFEKTSSAKNEQPPECDEAKSSLKSEDSKKSKDVSAEKSRKDLKDVDADENQAALASVEGKIEKAVAKLKKGLGGDVEGLDADSSGSQSDSKVKDFDLLKKAFKNVRDASKRGAKKSASETGIAPLFKDGLSSGAEKTESAADNETSGLNSKMDLALKLSGAAENAKLDIETKAAAEGLSEKTKPGIELVALNADIESAADKQNSAKTKKVSKLRVVDHRAVSASSDKAVKAPPLTGATSFSNDFDAAGKLSELNTAGSQADSVKADGKTAESKMFQSSILSQLKDGVNNQIVKQAGIIVKGNGTGEIKLVMKPESLGKVRIQLSLNDNHIAGRIIVENNIVREIFESNLENLYKAFGSEGFEAGGLEVSVQGQGQNEAGNNRKGRRGFNGRAVKAMEEAVPELANGEWRNNAVNMVV